MEWLKKTSPIALLLVILILSYGFIAAAGYYLKNPPEYKQGFTPKDFEVPLPKEQWNFKQAQKVNRLQRQV